MFYRIIQFLSSDFIDMQVKYAEWLLIYRLLVVWLLDLISDLKLLRFNVAFILVQLLQVTFKRKWEIHLGSQKLKKA